ncbi:MAG: alpha-galactosidase [Lachnospiraceae bacterium]|nr:alpha-galactosidase [Lachnospiraceae bacterium]
MIRQLDKVFILDTKNTTYCFQVLESGHLEHLYYGKKLRIDEADDVKSLAEKQAFPPGNSNVYDAKFPSLSLENMRLEMSSYGKSDIREPFIEVIHADGSYTSDFLYETAVIKKGKEPLETLPSSYEDNGELQELTVFLKDKQYGLTLELHYGVFEDRDVISRSAKFINTSDEVVKLTRLMSTQLDFEDAGYILTTFNGNWAREMYRHDALVGIGKMVNASYAGTSSNRANPFVMLSTQGTTEDTGLCYGFNLIYSGNHYEAVEVNSHGKTRIVTGINPQSFCFMIEPGQKFESPEAVMTVSCEGYNGMSHHMHEFVRECIVRGEWKKKVRPVLLNSWEAAYFDINESKLLKLAKAGKEAGIELFVMDDGWFGTRNDDKQSLGDWHVNKKKLPGGLKSLCDKVNALGLDFGIWVEPEMVNTESGLYKAHSEWVMEIPGKPHSEGRNQRILDFANPEVVDFITEQMTNIFSSANISYVKWDMNRIFSDYYSQYLKPEQQGEVAHRYMMGLYRLMKTLTERFPHILFEGCASGGNRFDLGILCYFPQIWASDDTDAIYRAKGQTGYSYGYPMSVVTAHVSACPNHQTLRMTPLATRFNVAAFGVLGYECNLCDMKKEEVAEIKEQIALYKKWREVLQFGTFYRGRSGKLHEWTCVSPDKSKAVGMIVQELVEPNTHFEQYFAKGLDENKKYHFYNIEKKRDVKPFGDLLNTISPVHIKYDSLVHKAIDKFLKMPGEKEDYTSYGNVLMSGVKLQSAFGGTGYNENTRYFQDFESRLYFMEEA